LPHKSARGKRSEAERK